MKLYFLFFYLREILNLNINIKEIQVRCKKNVETHEKI